MKKNEAAGDDDVDEVAVYGDLGRTFSVSRSDEDGEGSESPYVDEEGEEVEADKKIIPSDPRFRKKTGLKAEIAEFNKKQANNWPFMNDVRKGRENVYGKKGEQRSILMVPADDQSEQPVRRPDDEDGVKLSRAQKFAKKVDAQDLSDSGYVPGQGGRKSKKGIRPSYYDGREDGEGAERDFVYYTDRKSWEEESRIDNRRMEDRVHERTS